MTNNNIIFLLQEEFKKINENKGNKDYFLKLARQGFPSYLNNLTDYNTSVKILQNRRILLKENEEVLNSSVPNENWYDKFAANVKKAEINPENIDFNQILTGFIIEKDKKENQDKSIQDLKDIVIKNLTKDQLYYMKEMGYTENLPGAETPKSDKMVPMNIKEQLTKMMKEDPNLVKAYNNGVNCAKKGKKETDNPFNGKSQRELYDAWYMGFNDTKSSLKESNIRKLINKLIKEELNYSGTSLEDAKKEAQKQSKKKGDVVHVNETSEGYYEVSDIYDFDITVASYENGHLMRMAFKY